MKKGAISAGHTETASAGAEVLQAGGSAIDAAVAALLTSMVCEPFMTAPGGGGFALVVQDNRARILDFFCDAPRHAANRTPREVTLNFGTAGENFLIGGATVAVPGMPAGLDALKKLTTMPVKDLCAHAVALAKDGHPLDDFQAHDVKLLEPIWRTNPKLETLFAPDGSMATEGSYLYHPALADTIMHLMEEGGRDYYQGDIARQSLELLHEQGSGLTIEDFQAYQPVWRQPLQFDHAGWSITTNPEPSAGGSYLQQFLNNLKESDSVFTPERNLTMLSKAMGECHHALAKTYEDADNTRGATTHISIMDRHGDRVAMTLSNGEGSGIAINGTALHFNNMLGEPGLPANPGERLTSMMAPTMAVSAEREILMGSGGSRRIPSMMAQVLRYLIREPKRPLSQAVHNPRAWHDGSVLHVEPGVVVTRKEIPGIERILHWPKRDMYFGGVHCTGIYQGEVEACGDQRRNGHSMVV